MKLETRLEKQFNKAIEDGIFPKTILLSKNTLKAMAIELRARERIIVPFKNEKVVKSHIKKGDRIAFFKIDNSIPDGKFSLK